MSIALSKPETHRLILALSLAGLSSFAQATVVGQATASVSNYSFSVKDLAPADGITPSFTVRHPWSYDTTTSVLKYTETASGGLNILESDNSYDRRNGSTSFNLFNQKPLAADLPSGDGHVEINRSGLSAAVVLNSDDFIGADYQLSRYGDWLNDYARAMMVGGTQVKADASGGYERWVLSPGSEVTVSGTIRLQASVNAAALTGLTPGDEVLAAAMATAQPIFYSNYSIWDNVEIIKNLPGNNSYVVLKAQERASDALGSLGRDQAEALLEQSFSYTIRNLRDTEVDMYFGLSVMARAGAAPIPEPSSWAMLLAGVGLTGLFARRRQAA